MNARARILRAAGRRLPERWQTEVVALGEAVSRIKRELVDIHDDVNGPNHVVGVWVRGLTHQDFDKVKALVNAPVWPAGWDEVSLATTRRTSFFMMEVPAVSPARAALRAFDWLTNRFDSAGITSVEGLRVEAENEKRLFNDVMLVDDERDVLAYLDAAINMWRDKAAVARVELDRIAERDRPSGLGSTSIFAQQRLRAAAEVAKAEHYIDAFQSARVTIFGELAP